MPLTPAEVHNVAFRKPPIGKRGYDEEEVDAFLDIVEVELARLIEENNDLRAQLGGAAPAPRPAEPVVAAVPDGADGADEQTQAELAASREEIQRLQSQVGELESSLNENRAQLEQAQQQAEQARQQAEQARQQAEQAGTAAPAVAEQPAQSTGQLPNEQGMRLLALAQQTADQHVAEARAEADRLLAETKATTETQLAEAKQSAETQVAEAQQRADQLDRESTARAQQTVQDAEQRAQTITSQLEQRKAALERRLEELRTFEREYRTRLKSYLESQLRDLDASGRSEPAAVPSDNGSVDAH
ncbi:DivIVA domain-containing protein [Jatrophihabitans sp. YIM 134969]